MRFIVIRKSEVCGQVVHHLLSLNIIKCTRALVTLTMPKVLLKIIFSGQSAVY